MADHNDPNAVNHIFSDIDYSPADLYDLFGWPTAESKNVVFALTFASAPAAGLTRADAQKLRAALQDLTECRRLLDTALAEQA